MQKKEKVMKILFSIVASVSILSVVLICVFLLARGIPAITKIGPFKFIFGKNWNPENNEFGIFPMILGIIYVTIGAIIVGVPAGLLCAIFMSKFCSKKLYKILNPMIQLLAGIPSIVYGFFGLMVLVPLNSKIFGGNGMGIITASTLLGIMILPTIISVAQSSIEAVPNSYYEGALALGATHEKSVIKVVVKSASSGITAGVILGVGRAIGETMALVMVAGNASIIPNSITSMVRTLTANIVLEMAYATDLHEGALIATGLVLFVFILIIDASFLLIKRKVK